MPQGPGLGAPDSPKTWGANSDVIVIGCSLGGFLALTEIFSHLPADLPAAVAVVQHRMPDMPGQLERLLDGRSQLRVKAAEHEGHLIPGVIHVAPGGLHLLINPCGSLELRESPKVRFCRPSVDRLFQSASCRGSRVLALILTGFGRDGTDGVMAVSQAGGLVFAQDEATSQSFGMPGSAIRTGAVDSILPLADIAPALVRWVYR